MRFLIEQTSGKPAQHPAIYTDEYSNDWIDINTIEDLLNLKRDLNKELIITDSKAKGNISNEYSCIEVYDANRE